MNSNNQEKQKKEKNLIVRSELNLENYNIFTVSTFKGESRELAFTETLPTGEKVERKAIIGKTAQGKETGVLNTYHQLIVLVLEEFWEDIGRPIDKPFFFSLYRIAKLLKMKITGQNFKMIKNWLLDLRQIPITFIDSFYLKNDGFTTTKPLSILSYLDIYEPREKDKRKSTREGHGEVRFDDHILKSLLNNYSHPIPLNIIASFKKHKEMCIKLYLYLDRKLAFQNSFHKRLEDLWGELDLSERQVRYPSDRKLKLQPVINQLKKKTLLTGILSYCEIQKTEDEKDYKLIVKKKPFTKPISQPSFKNLKQSSLPSLSSDLVIYFHSTHKNNSNHIPTSKELQQSQQLLDQYGEKTTRYIINYAISKMKETNFYPEHFGAVFNYTKGAFQNYQKEKQKKHYTGWQCLNYNCENSKKVNLSSKKTKITHCPQCQSKIEIVIKNYSAES